MIRGTTPTIRMKLPSKVAVGNIVSAMVSIEQIGKELINKHLSDMTTDTETNCLLLKLSQEETLSLSAQKKTNLQLKVKTADGTVSATLLMPIAVVDVINDEVI